MDQPDNSASGPPGGQEQHQQQSGASCEPSTQVIEPPRALPHDDRSDDPHRPTPDRREGVVCDPDVP